MCFLTSVGPWAVVMWTLTSNSCISAPQENLLLVWKLGEVAAGQTVTGDLIFDLIFYIKLTY